MSKKPTWSQTKPGGGGRCPSCGGGGMFASCDSGEESVAGLRSRIPRCCPLTPSPRKRSTGQSQAVPPLLRTSKRTIYTAGRPPWYNVTGNTFEEPFVIGNFGDRYFGADAPSDWCESDDEMDGAPKQNRSTKQTLTCQ